MPFKLLESSNCPLTGGSTVSLQGLEKFRFNPFSRVPPHTLCKSKVQSQLKLPCRAVGCRESFCILKGRRESQFSASMCLWVEGKQPVKKSMLHITYVHLKFKMQEKKSFLEAMKVAYLGSQKQPLNQFYLALENLKLLPH